MKIKLKEGVVLPNNWKACGHSEEDWQILNSGNVLDVKSISNKIKNNVDVVVASSKTKNKGEK